MMSLFGLGRSHQKTPNSQSVDSKQNVNAIPLSCSSNGSSPNDSCISMRSSIMGNQSNLNGLEYIAENQVPNRFSRNELGKNIYARLQSLYPKAAKIDEVGKQRLRTIAGHMNLSVQEVENLNAKLNTAKCNSTLALCIANLKNQTNESTTEFFIKDLAAVGGSSVGRENQILFALISADSSILFPEEICVDVIPPADSVIYRELCSSLLMKINKILTANPEMADDIDAIKRKLEPLVVQVPGEQQTHSANDHLNLSPVVFDALFSAVMIQTGLET